MSKYSDIQFSLVEGQRDVYGKMLAELKESIPSGRLNIDEEYLRNANYFDIGDLLPVISRYPGLLVELDVRGEYEEDSCRIRLRGERSEVLEKTYPQFSELLSSAESRQADATLPANINLEAADKRALSLLRLSLREPFKVNSDLPGNELSVAVRAGNTAFLIDVNELSADPQNPYGLRVHGTDPATGFEVSAYGKDLLPGQATLIAQYYLNNTSSANHV